jgi:hypothetical protein
MKAALGSPLLVNKAANDIGINSGSQTIANRRSSVTLLAGPPLALTTANLKME